MRLYTVSLGYQPVAQVAYFLQGCRLNGYVNARST